MSCSRPKLSFGKDFEMVASSVARSTTDSFGGTCSDKASGSGSSSTSTVFGVVVVAAEVLVLVLVAAVVVVGIWLASK